MTTLRTSLDERKEEFNTHYALALALQDRIFSGAELSIGETVLSSRHLLTMQSGLIIHLYNIVESTMAGAMKLVGAAVGAVPPSHWTKDALREWLREHAVARINGDDEARLKNVHNLSLRLLQNQPLGPQALKKPLGSWADEQITAFARRLGITFEPPEEIRRRTAKSPEYGDMTPLRFLADRRNALAHGLKSFEKGASDLTLPKIRALADITLDYLSFTADAFQDYVDQNLHIVTTS